MCAASPTRKRLPRCIGSVTRLHRCDAVIDDLTGYELRFRQPKPQLIPTSVNGVVLMASPHPHSGLAIQLRRPAGHRRSMWAAETAAAAHPQPALTDRSGSRRQSHRRGILRSTWIYDPDDERRFSLTPSRRGATTRAVDQATRFPPAAAAAAFIHADHVRPRVTDFHAGR